MFEGIAKTNTTHTHSEKLKLRSGFESVAKTNTTRTREHYHAVIALFESVAKTNTTRTQAATLDSMACLRVLLKQIQPTHGTFSEYDTAVFESIAKTNVTHTRSSFTNLSNFEFVAS